MPEGEEEDQEIKKLFEKIMKEHFPNLANEIDMQVHEAQSVPKKLEPRRNQDTSQLHYPRLKTRRES